MRHEVVIVQWCSVTSLECFLWLLRIHFTRKSGKVLLCLQYWLGAQVSQWSQNSYTIYYVWSLQFNAKFFTTLNSKISILKVNYFHLSWKKISQYVLLFFNNKIQNLYQFSEKKSQKKGFKSCCQVYKSIFGLKYYQNFIIH